MVGIRFVGGAALLSIFSGSLACSQPVAGPVAFGGQGANISEPSMKPLPADDEYPKMEGPCEQVSTPSDFPLIEDFEDGNNQLFKTLHREGWWFSATDGTADSVIKPVIGGFAAEELSESESSPDNLRALHASAAGQTDWGAVWGTTMSFKKQDLTCPWNASNFDGLEFWAKGEGVVHLRVNTVLTSPVEMGGLCAGKCWDAYSKEVRLNADWQRYVVPWEILQQGGWGDEVPFESERLLTVVFAASPEELPADFWVDNLRFWRRGDVEVPRVNAQPGALAASAPNTEQDTRSAPSDSVPAVEEPPQTAGDPKSAKPPLKLESDESPAVEGPQ